MGEPIFLSGPLAIESSEMPSFARPPGNVEVGNDHADRAGPGRRLRKNCVWLAANGHRDVVAAARTNAAHADDDRQLSLFGQLAQVVIDEIAARDCATGRVDSHDDANHIGVLPHAVDLLFGKAVFALHDCATHFDDRNLLGGELGQRVILLLRHIGRAEVAVVSAVHADADHHGDHECGQEPFAESAKNGRVSVE